MSYTGNLISEEEIGSLLLKDIRILFNTNDKGQISDLLVVEFTENNNPMHLYGKYDLDVGNCLSSWNRVTVAFIIFDFFACNTFASEDVKEAIWDNEFRKIKEIVEQLNYHYIEMLEEDPENPGKQISYTL